MLVPAGVVTVTATAPAVPAGELTLIDVEELTTRLVAARVPNFTTEEPVKPVPVRVTAVAPAVGPAAGLTRLTVGKAS